MSAIANQLRDLYQKKDAEAKAAWGKFAKTRDDAKDLDPTSSEGKEAYKVAHEQMTEYETIRKEADGLREQWTGQLAIDGVAPATEKGGGGGGADSSDEIVKRLLGMGVALPQKTAGEVFTESAELKALQESGVLEMEKAAVKMDPVKAVDRSVFKTLLTGAGAPGTQLLRNERLPGYLPFLQAPIQLLDLITVGETDSNVVEWVRQSALTNNAAEVAEATATTGASGTKPESAMTFVIESTTVRTIAHWIPATKQALQDIPQLRTIVDAFLIDGVRRRLNREVLLGDGVAPNLLGILNTPGIGSITRGTGPGVAAGEPSLEAILRAITTTRLAFFEPSAILLHPNDFLEVRLAKDANGNYLFGPPSQAGAETIWGVRVVLDTSVTEGTAVVGDWSQAILYVRDGVQVAATDSHSDFFVRNMVVILAEGRYAVAVPRPGAFTQVLSI